MYSLNTEKLENSKQKSKNLSWAPTSERMVNNHNKTSKHAEIHDTYMI